MAFVKSGCYSGPDDASVKISITFSMEEDLETGNPNGDGFQEFVCRCAENAREKNQTAFGVELRSGTNNTG